MPPPSSSSSSSSSCTVFFKIQELVDELVPFLHSHDLAQLMKTSCIVYTAVRPHFWRLVDMRGDDRVDQLVGSPSALKGLSDNISSVKNFRTKFVFLSFYYHEALAFLDHQQQQQQQQQQQHVMDPRDSTITTTNKNIRRPSWLPTPKTQKSSAHRLPIMSRLIKLDYSSDRQYKGSNFAIALGLCNATPMHFPLCWVLENSCTTLTQVHLHELDLPYIEAIRVLARTLSKLQVLARLQIAYNSNANNKVGSNSDKTPPTTTLLNILFFCCPPSLVSFIMVGRLLALKRYPGLEGLLQPREGQLDWDEGKVLIRQEPLLNLKELLLPACPQGYTAEEICPILEHCPNLDCWSIPDFKYDSTRTEVLRVFRETIPRRYGHPSRLLAITSTPCLQFRGEGVIEIMEALPEQQLRDIVCQHFYDASHVRFAAAIMRHSETLQNFLINRSNGVQSSTIQTVLANCKALKVLWVSSNRGGGSIRLLLEDAVAQDWACTRLDQLKIFMDLGSSGALGDVLLTEVEQQERWVKLEKFYRQLGRLTELSILDIRCVRGLNTLMGGLTIPYQKLSLPGLLSLPKAEEGEEGPGTGVGRKRGYLHLLARLKDLRMIRGSFWAHTVENREMVGQAEMEWIVKTFPKLEQFELMPENYQALGGYVVPEHLRWLQRERPQLVLFRAGEQEKK